MKSTDTQLFLRLNDVSLFLLQTSVTHDARYKGYTGVDGLVLASWAGGWCLDSVLSAPVRLRLACPCLQPRPPSPPCSSRWEASAIPKLTGQWAVASAASLGLCPLSAVGL